MRTGLFLLAGVLLMSGFLLLGKLFAGTDPGARNVLTIAFVALWLCVAAINLWMGVTRAGYSVTEELPIFLLIFVVPVALALVLRWKFL
jgi:hypothetical protein